MDGTIQSRVHLVYVILCIYHSLAARACCARSAPYCFNIIYFYLRVSTRYPYDMDRSKSMVQCVHPGKRYTSLAYGRLVLKHMRIDQRARENMWKSVIKQVI